MENIKIIDIYTTSRDKKKKLSKKQLYKEILSSSDRVKEIINKRKKSKRFDYLNVIPVKSTTQPNTVNPSNDNNHITRSNMSNITKQSNNNPIHNRQNEHYFTPIKSHNTTNTHTHPLISLSVQHNRGSTIEKSIKIKPLPVKVKNVNSNISSKSILNNKSTKSLINDKTIHHYFNNKSIPTSTQITQITSNNGTNCISHNSTHNTHQIVKDTHHVVKDNPHVVKDTHQRPLSVTPSRGTKRFDKEQLVTIIKSMYMLHNNNNTIKLHKIIRKMHKFQILQILFALRLITKYSNAPIDLLKNTIFNFITGNVRISHYS